MGKRKRHARRDARETAGAARPGARFGVHAVDEMIDRAVAACSLVAHVGPAGELVGVLARGPAHPEGLAIVDRALGRGLVDAVGRAWARGWQPADVHRVVQRTHGRAHGRLSAAAMGCEALRYAADTVPARWRLQLDAVGAEAPPPGDDRWAVPLAADPNRLFDRGDSGGVPSIDDRAERVRVAVETLSVFRRLPPLPRLAPGPGEAPSSAGRGRHVDPAAPTAGGAGTSAGADPRILHRVAALLAKAESTTFPDEAEALTAKAQQLVTRHAIDMAAVDAERGRGPEVAGRRIGIDDPYARARLTLLSEVAMANRCRAVWSQAFGFATVFGDEGDLDAVEMLFTSLLVQATRAMVADGPSGRRPGPAAGSATRSFRQSFLVAYARRIGDRLRQASEAAVAEADAAAGRGEGAGAMLPVLARRADAAEAAASAAFPKVKTFSPTARDPRGWAAGQQAADRADLGLRGSLGDRERRVRSPGSLGAA